MCSASATAELVCRARYVAFFWAAKYQPKACSLTKADFFGGRSPLGWSLFDGLDGLAVLHATPRSHLTAYQQYGNAAIGLGSTGVRDNPTCIGHIALYRRVPPSSSIQ